VRTLGMDAAIPGPPRTGIRSTEPGLCPPSGPGASDEAPPPRPTGQTVGGGGPALAERAIAAGAAAAGWTPSTPRSV
jgi:hypothetical protein